MVRNALFSGHRRAIIDRHRDGVGAVKRWRGRRHKPGPGALPQFRSEFSLEMRTIDAQLRRSLGGDQTSTAGLRLSQSAIIGHFEKSVLKAQEIGRLLNR